MSVALPSALSGPVLTFDRRCPLTGEDNQCRLAAGSLYKGRCWCDDMEVPAHVLRHLAAQTPEPVCLSRRALEALALAARQYDAPDAVVGMAMKILHVSAAARLA